MDQNIVNQQVKEHIQAVLAQRQAELRQLEQVYLWNVPHAHAHAFMVLISDGYSHRGGSHCSWLEIESYLHHHLRSEEEHRSLSGW